MSLFAFPPMISLLPFPHIKSKGGSAKPKGKPGRKPKQAHRQVIESNQVPPPKAAPTGGDDLIESLEALKPLVAQLGPDKVKRPVDLIS